MWDLVVKNRETKHSFYESVRMGWNLDGDERLSSQLSIQYNPEKNGKEYKWMKRPTRGGEEGISWEETMLWIGMVIGHRSLCKYIWGPLKRKDSILLYVM